MAMVRGKDGKQRAIDYPSELSKKEPAVAAVMAMKRDKHKKRKPKEQDDKGLQSAAARRLANLNKGK